MKLITKTVQVSDNIATGSAMRQRRMKKGHTLRAVANAIGVSAAFLSDLELGRRNWTEDLVRRIEEAL